MTPFFFPTTISQKRFDIFEKKKFPLFCNKKYYLFACFGQNWLSHFREKKQKWKIWFFAFFSEILRLGEKIYSTKILDFLIIYNFCIWLFAKKSLLLQDNARKRSKWPFSPLSPPPPPHTDFHPEGFAAISTLFGTLFPKSFHGCYTWTNFC